MKKLAPAGLRSTPRAEINKLKNDMAALKEILKLFMDSQLDVIGHEQVTNQAMQGIVEQINGIKRRMGRIEGDVKKIPRKVVH